MIFRDLVTMPLGNLWRIKLRSALTISGVMIAIGTFVAMLSFGAGNEQYVTEQWEKLGLFNTMYVYPLREDSDNDTTQNATLNDSAIVSLALLPGVEFAYPFASFDVTAIIDDSSQSFDAQALPLVATETKMFSQLKDGRMFETDSAQEVVVTTVFLKEFEIDSSSSVIGKQLVLSVERLRLDSAVASLLRNSGEAVRRVFHKNMLDSLKQTGYMRRIMESELSQAANSFSDGFFNSPAIISDTLTIVGVLKTGRGRGRLEPVLIPMATAERFYSGGMSNNPTELLASVTSGSIDFSSSSKIKRNYPRVTLQLDRHTPFQTVKDSIEALGFRSFSYAEKFEELSKFFFYFDFALALIGMIALTTASLGIVNTMVMSISERRREIGVLKSLGASERDIKILFLFESALIGSIGAVCGILLGWGVARISSAVVQFYMAKDGIEGIELFVLPWWLVLIAFAFGLLISILAGAYPAARAAKIDPMEALRTG